MFPGHRSNGSGSRGHLNLVGLGTKVLVTRGEAQAGGCGFDSFPGLSPSLSPGGTSRQKRGRPAAVLPPYPHHASPALSPSHAGTPRELPGVSPQGLTCWAMPTSAYTVMYSAATSARRKRGRSAPEPAAASPVRTQLLAEGWGTSRHQACCALAAKDSQSK